MNISNTMLVLMIFCWAVSLAIAYYCGEINAYKTVSKVLDGKIMEKIERIKSQPPIR